MKVSIITATYNCAATVADTIRCIQNQTYKNIEHIIIDGESSDNTLTIIRELHTGILISEKDNGIYDAMNKGINLATGDIIGILNADDFYADETVIENVVNTFIQSNCEAVYGDLFYVDGANVSKIKRKWIAGKYKAQNFLKGWMPPHPTFFVQKNIYHRYGGFDLSLGSAADYELMLRFLYKNKITAEYINKILVYMRTGGVSNKTLMNRIKANKGDRKAWKLNGLKPHWYTLILKPARKLVQFISHL